MKKGKFIIMSLAVLMLIVTACGPLATPTALPPTAESTTVPVATSVPATAMPAASMPAAANVSVGKSAALGSILIDSKGMTLYLFTKDTPNTSTCYDKCATSWPPLLTTGSTVAGDGADGSKLGTTKRTDGSLQVTYNGWPLYYFAKDIKSGDTLGENIGSVWYAVSPAGAQVMAQATAMPVVNASGPANVMVGKNDKLGSFLVDDKGMSLYLFTQDKPNTSSCYDKCAAAWPPLLTAGAPIAGTGADTSKLGTTKRTDGSMQVTYNGWPLYYFKKDTKPGDVTGQGVGQVWYVIDPSGAEIMK